jgi:hypothetical protein
VTKAGEESRQAKYLHRLDCQQLSEAAGRLPMVVAYVPTVRAFVVRWYGAGDVPAPFQGRYQVVAAYIAGARAAARLRGTGPVKSVPP